MKKFIYILIIVALFVLPLNMGAQTKRALLVGISNYSSNSTTQWTDIHGANDVELIAATLKSQRFSIAKVTNKQATAKRIRKELTSLVRSCRAGDVVYIHFSGHGQPFEDKSGDENDGWDESIIPYDAHKAYSKGMYEGSNHILDDELYGFFDHGTKDAFSPNGKKYRPRVNTNGHFVIKSSGTQGDILILEACRSYQSNYEIKQDGQYYGPLSYYVNKTLRSSRLTNSLNWVHEVKRLMDGDRRLTRQNMVYETSLK